MCNETDYYSEELGDGCCLKCEFAEPGCLCYECECKKCYWYIPPEEWDDEKGKCRLVLKWKKEKEEKFKNIFNGSFTDYTKPNNKNQKTLF